MTCVICLEALTNETHTLVDCEHEFHTNCIMQWFRSGKKTCPLCVNEGSNYINRMVNYSIAERCHLIEELKTSQKAPKHLEEELNAYKECSDKIEKLKGKLDTFMNASNGTYNILKKKIHTKRTRIKQLTLRRDRRWKRLLKHGICIVVIPVRKTIFSE